MEKYFEVEDLSPSEALKKFKAEGSLVDAVQDTLEDPSSLPPSLQYDSSEDPEMNEAASLVESFSGTVRGLKLNENVINGFNLRKAISDFIKEKRGRVSEDDFDEFYDRCQDGYDNWDDPRNKEGVRKTFEKNLEKMGLSGFDDEPEPEPEPFDITKTSKMTQDLVALYTDYAESASSVKESVDAKYDAIYDVVANIIEGTSFKKHAFICGDAGVGKCAVGETIIPIRVDDIIAKEIEDYLNTPNLSNELNIRIDDLYNFIAMKVKQTPKNDEFIDVPFNLELKGKDGWEKCSAFIKKQAETYKITTEKGRVFEGADKHILMLNPETDEGIYMEHCDVGTEIPYISDRVALVNSDVGELKDVYSPSMDVSHIYYDAQGFAHHNTYSVKKCVKELWDSSPLKAQGWTYKYQKGSIGTSIAPITAWLYENRDRKVCVLDDADAFLAVKDNDAMNMFKAALNTENTLQNPEPITSKATIRKVAATYISDKSVFAPTKQEIETGLVDVDSLRECEKAGIFEVNKEKFNEGILEVSIEGEVVCSQRMSEAQINSLRLVKEDEYRRHLEERAHNSKVNGIFGLTLREGDLVEDYDPKDELIGGGYDDGNFEIPEAFCFTSRVIVISNLAPSKIDDAFRSRCDIVPVTLTHEEFIAHCQDIIPGMMLDLETSLPQDLIISIRDLMYGYATLIIEMEGQKIGPNWPVIKINLPLQFRLFSEMAGKWLAIAKAYCRRNKMDLNMKTFPIVQKAIEARFLMTFIIPMFADNVYNGGHDLKRR